MSDESNRVRVEGIEWASLLPCLRLLGSLRLAMHPSRLLLGLVLIAGLWLVGRGMDVVVGPTVYDGEFVHYVQRSRVDFDRWREGREEWSVQRLDRVLVHVGGVDLVTREALLASRDRYERVSEKIRDRYEDKRLQLSKRAESGGMDEVEFRQLDRGLHEQYLRDLRMVDDIRPSGVYDTAEGAVLGSVKRLLSASVAFRIGVDGLLRPGRPDGGTVVGALHELFVLIPGWACRVHPFFGFVYGVLGLAWWALIGGAIARMVAVEATRDEPVSLREAVEFGWSRWVWFVLTPVLPVALVGAVGLAMALGGMLFFNAALLDLVGGALFFLALGGGAVIAVLMLLQVAAAHLYYPAIAVEGTDSFDALTRAFGYVVGRPWRWLFYTSVALVYGALTYLLGGVLVLATLWVTHKFVGAWVRDIGPGVSRFDAMMPAPRVGNLAFESGSGELSGWSKPAAGLVYLWVHGLVGLLGAYVVSYYFSASTWVYLLLRRSADGVEFDDVYMEAREELGHAGGASEGGDGLGADAADLTEGGGGDADGGEEGQAG